MGSPLLFYKKNTDRPTVLYAQIAKSGIKKSRKATPGMTPPPPPPRVVDRISPRCYLQMRQVTCRWRSLGETRLQDDADASPRPDSCPGGQTAMF
jgi:hypothetical protein